MKAMAVHDGSLFEDMYNLLNAWLAIVPSNGGQTSDDWLCSKPMSPL